MVRSFRGKEKSLPHADTLHVLGTTGINEPIDLIGAHWVLGPHIREDRDHIRVAVQQQRWERRILALECHNHRRLSLHALYNCFHIQ